MAALARLLPERDPHPNLYEVTLFVLGFLDERAVWPALVVRWELALLEELGFGLDLAVLRGDRGRPPTSSTSRRNRAAPCRPRPASPTRSGCWRCRPSCAPARTGAVTAEDVRAGFALTGHFLDARVLRPRDMQMPDARARLLSYLRQNSPV